MADINAVIAIIVGAIMLAVGIILRFVQNEAQVFSMFMINLGFLLVIIIGLYFVTKTFYGSRRKEPFNLEKDVEIKIEQDLVMKNAKKKVKKKAKKKTQKRK